MRTSLETDTLIRFQQAVLIDIYKTPRSSEHQLLKSVCGFVFAAWLLFCLPGVVYHVPLLDNSIFKNWTIYQRKQTLEQSNRSVNATEKIPMQNYTAMNRTAARRENRVVCVVLLWIFVKNNEAVFPCNSDSMIKVA